jgi:hypothetical protein
VGPELLLFTKHLLSIAVMEVDEATGAPKVLLRVSTSNAKDVSSAREKILAQSMGSYRSCSASGVRIRSLSLV